MSLFGRIALTGAVLFAVAVAAVLLLVFRDTILGLVASIQLTGNNMIMVGDWIEMPQYGADGDVMEVGLTTVKVQNFDKTVCSVPSYALISDSFKNWRGMTQSGGGWMPGNYPEGWRF